MKNKIFRYLIILVVLVVLLMLVLNFTKPSSIGVAPEIQTSTQPQDGSSVEIPVTFQ